MNLVAELREGDVEGFKNFVRMPPDIFDRLLVLIGTGVSPEQHAFRVVAVAATF